MSKVEYGDRIDHLTVKEAVWYLEEKLDFLTEVRLDQGTIVLDDTTVVNMQEAENIVIDSMIADHFNDMPDNF